MEKKRKPSAKPRQTKSTKAPQTVSVVAVKTPPVPRPLWPVLAGMAGVIGLLLVLRGGAVLHWNLPRPEWPQLPEAVRNIEIPDIDYAPYMAWLRTQFQSKEEAAPQTDAVAQTPLPYTAAAEVPLPVHTPEAETAEALKLKQQLQEAEAKIKQLQVQVEEKEQAIAQEVALRGKSLVGQYARLVERALEDGLPFPWELEQLERIAAQGKNAEVLALTQALKPYAQGVPSQVRLAETFRPMADAVLLRYRKVEAGDGVIATFSQMLHQIITIRRIGLVEGETPEAILARAEYHLEHRQLKQAAAEMATLGEPYINLVKPWLQEVTQKLEADQHAAALHQLTLHYAPTSGLGQKADDLPIPASAVPPVPETHSPTP